MIARMVIGTGLLALVSGCGYTTQSSLPEEYQTVFVSAFQNTSKEYDLQAPLTNALRRKFLTGGRLQPVDHKGADLIICYNPFRPFLNRIPEESDQPGYFAEGQYLADRGLKVVVNQVFRTLLHSRLKLGMQRYVSDDRFRGDIVLLEPREHDANFFAMNPLAFWRRSEAVQQGFESVRDSIERNFDQLSRVLDRYGLEMSRDDAQRKADAIREERGWNPVDAETEGRSLRLVGA
jgi:hypothetical protein